LLRIDQWAFGSLWYAEPNAISNAVGYAKFYSRSQRAELRVFDPAGAVIEPSSFIDSSITR